MKKLLLFLFAVIISFGAAARMRSHEINPSAGTLKIKNVAGFPYDYSNFQLTINGNFFNLNSLNITSGNLNAGINEIVAFAGLVLAAQASIALWYPGTFPGNPTLNDIIDFVQYGAGGLDFEALAVAAGLWAAGTFIQGLPPYLRIGGDFDEGVNFWQNSGTTSIADLVNFYGGIHTFPNPFNRELSVVYNKDFGSTDNPATLYLIDVTGKAVYKQEDIIENKVFISSENLAPGVYTVNMVNTKGEIINRKVIKQ